MQLTVKELGKKTLKKDKEKEGARCERYCCTVHTSWLCVSSADGNEMTFAIKNRTLLLWLASPMYEPFACLPATG